MKPTCTYGIPPNHCGQPAVVTLPAKGHTTALFFCAQHEKIARNAFPSLQTIPKKKDP